MRILVTGAAGFVGSHLCEELLRRGNNVIGIDNLHTGRLMNLESLLSHPQFEFVLHDVVNPYKFDVDQIYNLACPASPVHYQHDPIKTFETSVWGMKHALVLGQQTGARVFQASTSEIYGDPTEHPQRESYWGHVNPIGPRSCYDEGKRAAETMCFNYSSHLGVQIRVVRIFNTYGPRMLINDGRVVSNFIVQALRGEDITIYGDGTQTRSFCYVDDLVRGIISMMDQDSIIGPVNLGNPKEHTVRELADRIISLTNSQSQIVHLPLPIDDPTRRQPDITHANDYLDWSPAINLDEGIQRTVDYFKCLLSSRED